MPTEYANIIVDITSEKLDKTFQYRIPPHLKGEIREGSLVEVPFGKGNRSMRGYVVELTDRPEFEVSRIKEVSQVIKEGIPIESQLIGLAAWMRHQYGSTMNQALKTVIPVKKTMGLKVKRYLKAKISKDEINALLVLYKNNKRYHARVRLLEAFLEEPMIPYDILSEKLHVSPSTIRSAIKEGFMEEVTEEVYRNPVLSGMKRQAPAVLLTEQKAIVDDFIKNHRQGERGVSLIHGVTGSGKTEVYMEMIQYIISTGQQVIVLIPEIALTYQTVMRFYKRFGGRVSIVNSKLSAGERYDQFLRAKRNELDIMIGPRSALFTPFPDLGCIIIDEEHEGSYKSETSPRYHAREAAIERARRCGASVILGSATPSAKTYYSALRGDYRLYRMMSRATNGSSLPDVEIVDLRQEMKDGNKSIFSRRLKTLIEERLELKQQVMLFLNRRGYSGFISCRSCGEAMKCPHCDVSLTTHRDGTLVCHYCGHTAQTPKTCPACGSPYMAAFGIGTQKVEALAEIEFPGAKILRMDFDTTKKKGGHEKILSAFSDGEADILIGTQMIVKGHDFPNVTLVGILAADLSLNSGDFQANERTFQLLTQAAGRAGRGSLKGTAVIQTYQPDHYCIQAASKQDYVGFYSQEILYRNLLGYPPVYEMMTILVTSGVQKDAEEAIRQIGAFIEAAAADELVAIGPTDAPVSRINDIYRKVLHLKHKDRAVLVFMKDEIEKYIKNKTKFQNIAYQFEFH